MISYSILKACEEITNIYKCMGRIHKYDPDIHPDWVVEDEEYFSSLDIEKAGINTEHLPTLLEERLRTALRDAFVSQNIEAEIEAMDMAATERSLMPGRI